MTEYIIRFVAGGAIVSIFALIGDILRPKSFAGLLGAAPSVAIVSLAIGIFLHGPNYAATQATFMLAGAVALFAFSILACHLLKRAQLAVAFGLYRVMA